MQLEGMHVAILAAEGVEDLEFWVTVMRLREEGARVTSAGMARGSVRGKNGLAIPIDVTVDELEPAELDGLVLPGGWAPDKLRRYPVVIDLIQSVHAAGRPIGIICHGGLLAISAKIVAGGRATGSLGIRDDLVNAGGTWVDERTMSEAQTRVNRKSQIVNRNSHLRRRFCRPCKTMMSARWIAGADTFSTQSQEPFFLYRG